MRFIYALLTVLLFSIYIQAQSVGTLAGGAEKPKEEEKTSTAAIVTTTLAAVKKSDDTTPTEVSVIKKENGKIVLPFEKKSPVTIPKFAVAPVIDGNPDDEIWKQGAIFKDFYQTNPGDNIAASKPTVVYVGYDEKNLYLVFRCYDDRDKIRATVAKRDEVFGGEDNVRIWLDTYNDQRRAYVIGFNPLGIQADGIYTEGQGSDFSVDIVMESKGAIYDWGWAVEAKIPFKSLRYTAGKGKLWGFNVARNIDRLNDELDQWMPNDRNISGMLIQQGKIQGLDEIKYERTLEVVPSLTLSESGRRVAVFPNGATDRFVNQPIRQDFGVTMKYTITPNITLDAAYNPDFAEVEADAPVVSANQRFPVYFEEKRPFFLEGAEIFQSPLQVFYSRTIVDPDLAAKLTGKVGKYSFGFLAASDKAPGNYDVDERNDPSQRTRISEFLDKNATFAVLRLKRDFGKENNVGFFGTYRSFPEQKNALGGFDGRFKLDSKTILSFQAVATNSRRCFFDAGFEPSLNASKAQRNREVCGGGTFSNYRTGNGFAYTANYDYTAENFGYTFEVGGRSKDYRADAGFTRRVDSHFVFGGFRLSTKSNPKGKIIRANWFNGFSMNYNGRGLSQGLEWSSNLNLSLQKNTYINVNGGLGYDRIFEDEFGLKRVASDPTRGAFYGAPERSAKQGWISASLNKQFNKRISVGVFSGTTFNAFDYDFGAGPIFPRVSVAALAGSFKLDPGTGQQYDFGAEASWKPIDPLRIGLEFNKSFLVRDETKKTAFDSNIATLRATYQFTRFIFVRSRLDYNSIGQNFAGQLLFGWNPSPGKAFYIGYNDNVNYNGFNPYSGEYQPRFARNDRTFFVRVSYLFRMSF